MTSTKTSLPDRRPVRLSDTMAAWHTRELTLPPTLIAQADAIRNHGHFEGWSR